MTYKIAGANFGQLAYMIAKRDEGHIDSVLRTGLVNGLDSVALARQVIGSATVNGVDGATERTRHDIATIGLAAIKGDGA